MISFGFLFGTLPGFVLLLSLVAVVGLLFLAYRQYRPKKHKH